LFFQYKRGQDGRAVLFWGDRIATNVSMQLTLAFAWANANVPEVAPLTSGVARAEERASATQQLYVVLVEVWRVH
jgi:hypothetical protein